MEDIVMASKKKIAFGIILLLLLCSGIGALNFYRQPLGPGLELPTVTQSIPALTSFPVQEMNIQIESTATQVRPTDTQTAAPQPLCGGPEVMNILAIGSDARGDHYLYGLADIIRL